MRKNYDIKIKRQNGKAETYRVQGLEQAGSFAFIYSAAGDTVTITVVGETKPLWTASVVQGNR